MKPVVSLFLLALLLLAPPVQANTPSEDIPMYAVSLIGSPYRLGGKTPETGLDCSGFVGHVFSHIAGIVLPHRSLDISAVAQPLEPADLLPGDLVFFNTLNRAFSHVGIYLGENRFVHASSSRTNKVMVSSLNDRYWRTRFDGARRVVSPDEPVASVIPLE